jgi:hypothetical protein
MKHFARTVVATLILTLCCGGCSDIWEQATVEISYASPLEADKYVLQSFNRMRVEEVFRRFTKQHGYTCKAHIKRVEEIRCRGPRDLYLVFRPAPNKPEYIARFSWADVGHRTHAEFTSHVLRFEREFVSVVGAPQVRIQQET